MELNNRQPSRPADSLLPARRIACRVSAAAALAASLILMISSFWAGLQVITSRGVYSVPGPWPLLLVAVSCAALYEFLKGEGEVRPARPDSTRRGDSDPDGLPVSPVGIALGIAAVSLWLSVYCIYRTAAPGSVLPVLIIHLAAGAGAWGFWLALRRSGLGAWPLLGAGLWTVSPLLLPVAWPVAAAYALSAFLSPWLLVIGRPGKTRLFPLWPAAVVFSLGLTAWLLWSGHGWALGRLRRQLLNLPYGGIWWIGAAAGAAALAFGRSGRRGDFARLACLLPPAGALMGARGIWGGAGTVLALAPFTLLLVAGAAYTDKRLNRSGRVFFGNILFLCFFGLVLAWLRHSSGRAYPETRKSERAARSATSIPVLTEIAFSQGAPDRSHFSPGEPL